MNSIHPPVRPSGHIRSTTGLDRPALIARLTQPDDDLDLILLKPPASLTEAEVRRIAERRLTLPAGDEKEALDAAERAFYDHIYGSMPAIADGAGRMIEPQALRTANDTAAPVKSADGLELTQAIAQLAERIADVAESQGSRDAVRFLQRGLTIFAEVLNSRPERMAGEHSPKMQTLYPAIKDDGDPGPKTRAALRRATAKLGTSKVEEALALGRFENYLRGLHRSGQADDAKAATSASFGHLFRDPENDLPSRPTEEGESLQMALNDIGHSVLGSRNFRPLLEDGLIGSKTSAALKRVLKAAGARRVTESIGRNLGFFLFEMPRPGAHSALTPGFGIVRSTGREKF